MANEVSIIFSVTFTHKHIEEIIQINMIINIHIQNIQLREIALALQGENVERLKNGEIRKSQ